MCPEELDAPPNRFGHGSEMIARYSDRFYVEPGLAGTFRR
jgi:hypothetical protein